MHLKMDGLNALLPDKPTASNQQYRLTAKGDKYMESFKI